MSLNFAELLSSNTNSILLQEIFKTCSSVRFGNKSWSQRFGLGTKIVLRLFGILLIQWYITNNSTFTKHLWKILTWVIYQNKIYNIKDVKNKEYYQAIKYETIKDSSLTENSLFPIQTERVGSSMIISTIPFVHSHVHKEVEHLAETSYQNVLSKEQKTICFDNKTQYEPSYLFPSKNFKHLLEIVKNYFEVSYLLKSNSNLGILIDGEPGLGKTASFDFLGQENICGSIVRLDLTKQLEVSSITKIYDNALSKKVDGKPFMILFDELDKYLDYQIRKGYKKYKKDQETPDPFIKFKQDYKLDFLYTMLGILESNINNEPVILLFCSNNFNTIFEGIEFTHFESLYKRFLKVHFERCDYNELCSYLKYLNENFKETKWAYNDDDLENVMSKIRKDISIPYRELKYLVIQSGYDFSRFKDLINEWKDEEINVKETKDLDGETSLSSSPIKEKDEGLTEGLGTSGSVGNEVSVDDSFDEDEDLDEDEDEDVEPRSSKEVFQDIKNDIKQIEDEHDPSNFSFEKLQSEVIEKDMSEEKGLIHVIGHQLEQLVDFSKNYNMKDKSYIWMEMMKTLIHYHFTVSKIPKLYDTVKMKIPQLRNEIDTSYKEEESALYAKLLDVLPALDS